MSVVTGNFSDNPNPDIIKDDFADILMIFTDWSPLLALADKKYPSSQIKVRTVTLMSIAETERWILNRLTEIEDNWDDNKRSSMNNIGGHAKHIVKQLKNIKNKNMKVK